jgi:hypothetical protein
MLELPTTGIARSIKHHNSNLLMFCDWLEANTLFEDERCSFSDVIDQLVENSFYDSQDFAWEFIGNSISELRRRALHLNRAYPIVVHDRYLSLANGHYTQPYKFCLMLSMLPYYPDITRKLGSDKNDQANILEMMAEHSLSKLLPMWSTRRTGWSRENTKRLPALAGELARRLDAKTGDLATYANSRAKDCGLDVVTFRPFGDGRGGYPCLLLQCATGHTDWRKKRKEPDIELWMKLVTFDNPPVRGFVIPFAIDERDMRQSSTIVTGIVFDRTRLLLPGRDGDRWIPEELENKIDAWLASLLVKFPRN